jgi:cyclase
MKRVKLQVPLGAGGPKEFIPPALNPAGARLEVKRLAPGVYALVSDRPPVDNSGFVVGHEGVLVVDAHINATMARVIQRAVRQVTDKPILYLVNTNYHGDHTFGNSAFPPATTILAHRETAEYMRDFEWEKALLMSCVGFDRSVYGSAELRLPDAIFDRYLQLDLGGIVVELHHFGSGNTPGDTIVYVPQAQVAWTGNLFSGGISLPLLLDCIASDYLDTLGNLAAALNVETFVPGHGALATPAALGRPLSYLRDLVQTVRGALHRGDAPEHTLEALPLDERYLPPDDPAFAVRRAFLLGVHRWNVWHTYQALTAG